MRMSGSCFLALWVIVEFGEPLINDPITCKSTAEDVKTACVSAGGLSLLGNGREGQPQEDEWSDNVKKAKLKRDPLCIGGKCAFDD